MADSNEMQDIDQNPASTPFPNTFIGQSQQGSQEASQLTHSSSTSHSGHVQQPLSFHPVQGALSTVSSGSTLGIASNTNNHGFNPNRTLGKRVRDDWDDERGEYDDGMEEVAEHERYVKRRPYDSSELTPGMTQRLQSLVVASPATSVPGSPVPGLDLVAEKKDGVPGSEENGGKQGGRGDDGDDDEGGDEDGGRGGSRTVGNDEYLSINALLHSLALERANRTT